MQRYNINIIKQRCHLKTIKPGDFIYFEDGWNECFGVYRGNGIANITSLTLYPDTNMPNRQCDLVDVSLIKKGPAFIKCEEPEWWGNTTLKF